MGCKQNFDLGLNFKMAGRVNQVAYTGLFVCVLCMQAISETGTTRPSFVTFFCARDTRGRGSVLLGRR